MRIRLHDPRLLDELIAAFHAGECMCRRMGSDTCVVSYPAAENARERELELNFFLRAWADQHGGLDAVVVRADSAVQAESAA
jgi:hypothetical protein